MVPLSEPQEAPASRGFALADVLLPAGMPLELQCVGSDRHGATALASATVGVFATSKKTPGMLDNADAGRVDQHVDRTEGRSRFLSNPRRVIGQRDVALDCHGFGAGLLDFLNEARCFFLVRDVIDGDFRSLAGNF